MWGDDPKQNDDDVICIRVADFDYSKFSIKTDHLTLRSYGNMLSENKNLTKGDLLLEKSGGGELFPVGRVVRFNLDLGKTTCSNFIQKLSPSQKYCSSFLCYLFSSMYTKKVNGLFYNQTTGIQNLKIKEYLNQTVFLPPLDEQTAIANYLDTITAKIDAAIAQQQKMIDLLNERKQIIINCAVTKGLNPNAKMKDSGVEWIGEVPEHWDVMRMRYLCSITTGNKDTINRVDDGLYPFYVRSPKVERINTYSYDGEAVLMAGDGVGAGKVFHYVNGKFDYHQRVYNFYNIKKIKAKLLYYYMKSHFRYVIEQLSAKSTVDSVRLNMIQDFLVVIPPMQEQLDLIEYLDSQMKNLDDSISMFENQISLLQERKQIIINEVVTGKVKVI